MGVRLAIGIALMAFVVAVGCAEAPPRVLFLSKSSGYEHLAIARRDGPSHVETVLKAVAESNGFELESTKDAGLIDTETLARFDAVVFYTTGDLTEAGAEGLFGGDGEPPMAATGIDELRRWVEKGGALIGFHSASDTFHGRDGSRSPYVDLLGGEFLSHGRQFEGRLRVVDTEHPAMASIPQGWAALDEWYTFKNLGSDTMHVLALLETDSDSLDQETYDLPDYPVIWCRAFGAGRVFYNAMGHREDVWDGALFQAAFVDALNWALGRSDLRASPNFAEVVPSGD